MKLHRYKMTLAALLVAAFLCAAAVRIVAFNQANAGPTVWMHLWQETDMHYFDAWARLVTAGDYLSADIQAPLHGWQIRLARMYAEHDQGRATTTGSFTREEAAAIWEQWMPPGSFYQDPLYAYILAAWYAIFDGAHRPVLIFQQLLGIATLWLLYLVTRHILGKTVATVSVAFAVIYPMAIFYELFLLRESFILFISFLLIRLAQTSERQPTKSRHFILGIVAGAAILLKSSLVVLIALLLFGRFVTRPGKAQAKPSLVPLAFAIIGMALVLTPLAYRNISCGLPFLGLSKEGAMVFALHNVANYPPMGGDNFTDGLLATVADVARQSDFDILPAISATIGTHPSWGSYLIFTLKKFAYLWSWFEIPSNENFYYTKLHIPVLKYLPLGLPYVMSLGLVGVALSTRRWRKCWPLQALILSNLFFLTFFLNLSRLKLPMAMALIPFAALATVKIFSLIKQKRQARLCGTLTAVAILTLFFINWPSANLRTIRADDYIEPLEVYYWPRIDRMAKDGDYQSAAQLCDHVLKTAPQAEIASLLNNVPVTTSDDFDVLYNFSVVYEACGEMQARAGQAAAAKASLDQGQRMRLHLDRLSATINRPAQVK